MRIHAIITARGGSKGLPRKNERLLSGKPLLAYTIEAARGCPLISRTLVSTEDPALKALSLRCGAEVVDRPAEFAADLSPSQDAVRHALGWLEAQADLPDCFALLQPTSPLRTAEDLSRCLKDFQAAGARSAVSVAEAEPHPYKTLLLEGGRLRPSFDEASLNTPRQALPKAYQLNGAIFVVGSRDFLKEGRFFLEPVMPFIMPRERSIDIDSESDLLVAEQALRRNP